MQNHTTIRTPFGELLRRTLDVYTRSFGALMKFAFLYVFPPLAAAFLFFGLIIDTVLRSYGHTLGRLGSAFLNGTVSTSIGIQLLPLAMWPVILLLVAWAVFLMPRYNGAMVLITGNALNGAHTDMRGAHAALRGGRYKRLIIVTLCVSLMAGAGSLSSGLYSNLVVMLSNLSTTMRTVNMSGVLGAYKYYPNVFSPIIPLFTLLMTLPVLATSVIVTLRAVLFSLSVPVALYENKRHFYAVAQSMRMAAGRFGAMLGGYGLFLLCFLIIYGVFAGLAVALGFAVGFTTPALLMMAAAVTFITPLPAVFFTVVYRDIRAAQGYKQFIRTNDTGK